MVSTFTPNIQLEEPARGDQVGTWDTPVNNNMTLVDKVVGAITTIGLNNSNVVLSSPQYQSKTIIFNSTLTGSVTITFPTSFTKTYEIQNLCTGTSAFTITLQTTVAGGKVIGAPQGDSFEIVNTGSDIRYHNFGRVGSYWDYAGSSVPNWISVCTVAPFLNCDGTTFSAATFPALAVILASTTLPDSRGRTKAALNQGTGRISSAASFLNGDTIFAGGGADSITLVAGQIPTITGGVTAASIVTDAARGQQANILPILGGAITYVVGVFGNFTAGSIVSTGTFVSNNTGPGQHSNLQPTFISGITMIRSA